MTDSQSLRTSRNGGGNDARRVRQALRRSVPFLLGVIALALVLNFVFAQVHPESLVARVGVENTYGVVFLIAAIGGLSSATGAVLVTTLATFAAGGAHPLLLGSAAGLGLFISDSLFFFAFSLGRRALTPALQERADAIRVWVESHPPALVALGMFVYLALTPLPNDVVTAAFGLAGYRYRWIAPILFVAAFTLAIGTAYGSALLWG